MQVHNRVRTRAQNILNVVVNPLTPAQRQALFTHARVNALFSHLQRFQFGHGVAEPAGWNNVTARNRNPMGGLLPAGQFDRLRVRTTPANVELVSRMAQNRFNPPFDNAGTPQYPAFVPPAPPAPNPPQLQLDFYKSQMLSIMCRTLNRLVNEDVQRRYVIPNALALARPLAQPVFGHAGVSRREVAEGFIHKSQRCFWRQGMLDAAFAQQAPNVQSIIDDRARLLEAEFRRWV